MKSKLSALLDNFDGGVLIEDENRQIAFVNKQFCTIFSIPLDPPELIGFDCAKAAEGAAALFEDPKDFLAKTEQIISKGEVVHGQLFKMTDGRILERDFVPVNDDDNLNKSQIWLYRDISKYRVIENSLKYRLKFEEMMTSLSYSFISAKVENLDRVLNFALEDIGNFISVDRAYVFQFNKNLTAMSNTYEWCNKGITPEINNLQDISTEIFPWWMEKLTNFENVVIDSIDDMPEEASCEKEILKSQGIQSLLVVPLVYSYELLGYMGFDLVKQCRPWNNDSVKLLRVFSNILSGALKRKENEEALIRSEKKYKSVVDNVTEVIFQTDSSGLWTFLNPAWQTITGFSVEESIGKNFLNYVHPEDRQRNQELFVPLIQREKQYCRHQIRYLTKDGSCRWIEVFARLTLDGNDNIIGTSGTLNDITTRKIQEDEIRKLSKAVETTPTAVLLSDLKGNIVFVNQGLLKVGNYTEQNQILNKKIFDFADSKGKEKLQNEIIPMLLDGKDWTGEMDVIKADGSILPVNLVCTIIKDEFNNPHLLLANFFDISELKRAEIEIRNALAKERELNEMKSRFVSLVSHEFRTPLAAILSSAEILEYYSEKFSAEKKQVHFQKIKSSINNLLDILNETSETNRIDSGKLIVMPDKIVFDNFIREILDEINSGQTEKPEILLKNSCRALELCADKKLLRQVTMNLISNAIKYTPHDKKIFINVSATKDEVTFQVKDQGIGIPEKEQERIFEPFTRSIKVHNIKGSGLGLSIVKKAVELLHGSISFISSEGIGSTFTVRLPLTRESIADSLS